MSVEGPFGSKRVPTPAWVCRPTSYCKQTRKSVLKQEKRKTCSYTCGWQIEGEYIYILVYIYTSYIRSIYEVYLLEACSNIKTVLTCTPLEAKGSLWSCRAFDIKQKANVVGPWDRAAVSATTTAVGGKLRGSLTIGISWVGNTSHTPSLAITTSDQSSSIVISNTSSQSGRITPGVPPSSTSFREHGVDIYAVERQGKEEGREVNISPTWF